MASAGYIQLAAVGQQDAYLTGNPSVTYFQGLYSRNTPFVLEAYDIPFNGSRQAFGTQSICKIPFKGDIVRGMTLKINMPFLNNPGNDWNWSNIASEAGFYPKISIDGKYFRGPTQGITYYSTNLQSQFQNTLGWMNNPAQIPFYASATVAPVTGTSITIPFNTGNVLPNYNMFPGYIGTTSVVTGNMVVASYTATSITFTIQSQTTGQIASGNTVYITGSSLSSNVIYDANINKFAITSYSNITVEPGQATFWGLDPKNFDNILPSGNLNYLVSSSSFHSPKLLSGRTVIYGDFTLEQGGWARGNGLPSATKRAGLYFQAITSLVPSSTGATPFRFVSRAGDSTQNYIFLDFSKYLNISQVAGSTFCFQSPQGCIGFTASGQYCIRGSFITNYPTTTYSVGYGLSTTDGHPGTAQFLSERIFTLSATTPTPIFTIPVNIVIPQGYSIVYMYIDVRVLPVNGVIQTGSWISIGPLDDISTVSPGAGLTTGTQLAIQNFVRYPNTISPLITLVPGTSNSFTFNKTGTYLMTVVLALQNSTLTSVTISNGTRGSNSYVYNTYQGQYGFASLDFVLPVYVNYTTIPYFIDISMQNLSGTVTSDTIIGSNVSYVHFLQNTALIPTTAFPENGLMFVPSIPNFFLSSPINFNAAGWTAIGGTTQMARSGSQIAMYVGGLYYLQAILCTSDTLQSVTVSVTGSSTTTSTHNISVGLLPPYVVGIPFYVPTASLITPALASISFLTTSGASTGVYSNTVFSLGIFASNLVPVYTYVDSVGTFAIKEAELRIGGQVIQSLSGEQIELYNDLYIPYENQPGLKLLTGKGDTSNVFDPGRTYYTNIPFYFYGNTELSIPVCALSRSDLEVAVTLMPFSNLTYVSNISSLDQSMSMTMIVEYGFLSENETRWMNNSRLNYLITQSQAVSFVLEPGFSTGVFNLPFLNPVRELYIVIQNSGQAPYDFSNNGLLNLGLKFNGQEFLSRQVVDSQYLQYVQTFQKYNVTPTRAFYVYSFANDPMNPRPTGQVNMSRIKDISLELTLIPLASTSRLLRVYAMNYNILRIENGLAGLLFNFSQVH